MSWDEAVTPRLTSSDDREPLPRRAYEDVRDTAAVSQYELRGAGVVVAHGSYDLQSIEPLADVMAAAAKKHGKIVFDASGVVFADSSLLNLLIRTHQRAALRVAAPTQQMQRLCALAGVDTLLEIRETVEAAAVS